MSFSLLRRERFWRQLHFYLGLLLFLQLLAWFASGVVMSWYPIEEVRGNHLRKEPVAANWQQAVVSPAAVLAQYPTARLSLAQSGTTPLYLLTFAQQELYINAVSGQPLAALSEADIRAAALALYQPAPEQQPMSDNQTTDNQQATGHQKATASVSTKPEIAKLQLLQHPPNEVRGLRAPLWQVSFNDAGHSTFYLHPLTGDLLRVRTDTWRLYDFFWMLHIMDYQDRSDFNHPLLYLSAGLALLFTLGGLILLGFRFSRARH